jgi:FixJ family two-component response regulator
MTDIVGEIIAGVDDDFRVQESIEGLIESAGYISRLFSSAEAFLNSDVLDRAVCVITDVCMPGMGGIELQRRIRRERPLMPIIFISAHHEDGVEQLALQEGAAVFLYKPFDATRLLDAIRIAVTTNRGE